MPVEDVIEAQPKKEDFQVPEIDVQKVIQGEWKVGATQCLDDPIVCK